MSQQIDQSLTMSLAMATPAAKSVSADTQCNAKDYFNSRVQHVNSTGEFSQAYPHKFDVTMTIPQFRNRFLPMLTDESGTIIKGKNLNTFVVNLAGRVLSKNNIGKKLYFIKIVVKFG